MQERKKKRGMRFIKKHHFKFNYSKNRCAYIIYKQTYSNFFVTLIDRKGHVINCITAGNSHVGFSIRQKRSPYAMEKICSRLMIFIRLYKIRHLQIYLKTRPTSAFFMLMRQLSLHQIRVVKILERICAPHNGIRAKKARRK